MKSTSINIKDSSFKNELRKLGLVLDIETGHLFYDKMFTPLKLSIEVVIVRHGETYGNCGQSTQEGTIDFKKVELGIKNRDMRIYQGNVDMPINQLTLIGKQQALESSVKLEEDFLKREWIPDLILHSPLSRAKETGLAFVKRNGFENRYIAHSGLKEMSFGAWENRRICDVDPQSDCHLLYLNQNVLVKESGFDRHETYQEAESFCETLLRAHRIFTEFDQQYPRKKLLLFSHSMFGAAACILAGRGQQVDHDDYLAFDGKRKNGSSYALPHAVPILLF